MDMRIAKPNTSEYRKVQVVNIFLRTTPAGGKVRVCVCGGGGKRGVREEGGQLTGST